MIIKFKQYAFACKSIFNVIKLIFRGVGKAGKGTFFNNLNHHQWNEYTFCIIQHFSEFYHEIMKSANLAEVKCFKIH